MQFGDLAAVLGLSESTVSHHLSQLRQAGSGGIGTPWDERLPPVRPRRAEALVHGAGPELLHLDLGHDPRAMLAASSLDMPSQPGDDVVKGERQRLVQLFVRARRGCGRAATG